MLRLSQERARRGWSQNELARRAHMAPADVCRIERQRLMPYDSQLAKLARALKIPIAEAKSLMEVVDPVVSPTLTVG